MYPIGAIPGSLLRGDRDDEEKKGWIIVLDRSICERFLADIMEYNDLPGIAIGVSSGGERWTGCAGVRDTVTKHPLEIGDIFYCASVSKLFTSTAILKLIDARVLNYDDRLADILPDLTFVDERFEDSRDSRKIRVTHV